MNLFFLILRWIVVGFLGLLSLLLLLLVIPVTVFIRYENGVFSVQLRLLFLKFKVLPKKNEEQPDDKEKGSGKQKKKKAGKLQLDFIREILPGEKSFIGRVMRHIRIKNVTLFLVINGKDAAEVGTKTGWTWMAIGALRPLLENLFRISWKSIDVLPDFLDRRRGASYFDCKVTALPVILLIAGIGFLVRFLNNNRETT